MSLSSKSRLFSASSFGSKEKQEIKHIEIKDVELKLPRQIKSRVAHNRNQKMMSDFAIGKIKTAVMKIIEEQQLIYKSQHPDFTQADLDNLKYRRFRKEEIEAALDKIGMEEIKTDLFDGKLPYGVYFAKIRRDDTEKEIFAFINKGVKEFIEKAKKESRDRIELEVIKANILDIGGMGIVKVMQDMDDPSCCYALKIIPINATSGDHKSSEEYKHAAQAGLALAHFIRPSPSHAGRMQEEILMEYVPGVNLEVFFDPFKKIGSKEPTGSSLAPLGLLILLQKMAISVQKSVHQFGSIHRDITLRNFIYDTDTGSVKLVDYGLTVTPTAESKGIYDEPSGFGTAGFLPVEVAFGGSFSQKSDVFALGTTMAFVLDMIDMNCETNDNPIGLRLVPYKLSLTPNPQFIKKIPNQEVRSYLETLLFLMKGRELKVDLLSELTPEQELEYSQEKELLPKLRPTVKECEEVLENIVKFQRAIDMNVECYVHKTKIEMLLHNLKQKYSELTVLRECSVAATLKP